MPFLGNIGAPELIIIAIIALVIFGPGKLPEVAQSLGRGVREFRKAASDVTDATKIDAPAPTPATPVVPPASANVPPVASASPPAEPPSGDAGQPSA